MVVQKRVQTYRGRCVQILDKSIERNPPRIKNPPSRYLDREVRGKFDLEPQFIVDGMVWIAFMANANQETDLAELLGE